MNVINWSRLQPTEADLRSATQSLQGVAHLRLLLQALVRVVLSGYPWDDRDDLRSLTAICNGRFCGFSPA